MSFLAKKYIDLLTKHPIKTKTITSSILFGAGDCICQNLFNQKSQNYNYRRTLNMMFMGLTMGSIFHQWYGILDKISNGPFKKFSTFGKVAGSVGLDQTVFAFSLNCYFLTGLSILQSESFQQGIQQGFTSIKEKIWTLMKTNWMVWPAAQIINFYFVPLPYRVLFVNFVGLGWNVILSYMTYQKSPIKQEDQNQK